MQVRIIKESSIYKKGVIDVTDARGKYLVSVGVAVTVEAAVEVKKPVKTKKGK